MILLENFREIKSLNYLMSTLMYKDILKAQNDTSNTFPQNLCCKICIFALFDCFAKIHLFMHFNILLFISSVLPMIQSIDILENNSLARSRKGCQSKSQQTFVHCWKTSGQKFLIFPSINSIISSFICLYLGFLSIIPLKMMKVNHKIQ